MKVPIVHLLSGILLTTLLLPPGFGSDRAREESHHVQSPPAKTKQANGHTTKEMPVYIPPLRGAPASRVGAASRGSQTSVTLAVLAPKHTGLTVRAQPTLYWYISQPTSAYLEFTLIKSRAIRPLIETRLEALGEAGIHRLDLSDYNVRLKQGAQYQWFVTLVPDAQQRSNDILAGGTVRRIMLSRTLAAKLAQADRQRRQYIYAKVGIWYDAFAVLSGLIQRHPADANLKAQRAALLHQVGLGEVAQDRSVALDIE